MKKLLLVMIFVLTSIFTFSQSTYTQSFTTAGSWICPAGVSSITVECWGGGGSGGGTTPSIGAGGGGAGGAYSKKVISVTPGSKYYFGVATSKVGGSSAGSQGDPSWFNSTGTNTQPGTVSSGVLAEGGVGGSGSGSSSAATGSKSSSFGDLTYKGGNGGAASAGGNLSSSNSGAGGGGSGSTGDGGPASGTTAGTGTSVGGGNGAAGVAYGSNLNGTTCSNVAGGGSGATRNSGTTKVGGSGGPGYVTVTYSACVPLFEQDFSASTTVSDYVNLTAPNHTQFNELSSSSIAPTITSNKIRFSRTDGATTSWAMRNTAFSTTPTSVIVKFDLTIGMAAGGTGGVSGYFYIGDAMTTASGSLPSASKVHSRLRIQTSNSQVNSFAIKEDQTNTISSYFSGTQSVTWVINNSGSSVSYLAPDGTTETLADDKADLWIGTTRLLNEYGGDISSGSTTATVALNNIFFNLNTGVLTMDVDNMTINPIVSSPTSSTGTSINCSGFNANWTTSSCSASLEVATNNTFTSMVSGYSKIVTGTSYSVTGLSAGTTYYYRLRTSMGSNSNAISSSYSTIQNITTTAPSVGGSVASNQNVMSGGNAATVNLSGHTGSVIKWQRSTISDFSTATDVANTTTSVNGASMGGITETIYYRAVVQNGTCATANSAYVTITVVSGLPIELLYFNGAECETGNRLYWSTASENNNDYFTIEKTKDGKEWVSIANMSGAGNSSITLYYYFMDESIERVINYYRLKQTDYDGKFKYSDAISIDNRNNDSKEIHRVVNALGQEVDLQYYRGLVIIEYSDGSSIKIIK